MALLILLAHFSQPSLPVAFPSPLDCQLLGHPAFTALQVLFDCPTTRSASLPTSHTAYRVGCPDATQEHYESSQGHALIFRTVPSAHTLVRWVDENAFASIVQARPCPPSLADRFVLGQLPRLQPGASPQALRIPPHSGHPALRVNRPGQRGITPAFGYSPPHPRARGTSTLLINALPGAHYDPSDFLMIISISSLLHLLIGTFFPERIIRTSHVYKVTLFTCRALRSLRCHDVLPI
jgi:hypothetical protein